MSNITIPAQDTATDWFGDFAAAVESSTGMDYIGDQGDGSAYGIYRDDDGELHKAWLDESASAGDTWSVGFSAIREYYVMSDDGQETLFAESFDAVERSLPLIPDADLVADGAWLVIRDELTMETREWGSRPQ